MNYVYTVPNMSGMPNISTMSSISNIPSMLSMQSMQTIPNVSGLTTYNGYPSYVPLFYILAPHPSIQNYSPASINSMNQAQPILINANNVGIAGQGSSNGQMPLVVEENALLKNPGFLSVQAPGNVSAQFWNGSKLQVEPNVKTEEKKANIC